MKFEWVVRKNVQKSVEVWHWNKVGLLAYFELHFKTKRKLVG